MNLYSDFALKYGLIGEILRIHIVCGMNDFTESHLRGTMKVETVDILNKVSESQWRRSISSYSDR